MQSDVLFNLCTAILLSVIYIEVCRRLNLTIVGARIGEEFLIWPQTGNPEVRWSEQTDAFDLYVGISIHYFWYIPSGFTLIISSLIELIYLHLQLL